MDGPLPHHLINRTWDIVRSILQIIIVAFIIWSLSTPAPWHTSLRAKIILICVASYILMLHLRCNSEMYSVSSEMYIYQTAKCFKCTIPLRLCSTPFSNIPRGYNRAYIYTITFSILHSLVICWPVPNVYVH